MKKFVFIFILLLTSMSFYHVQAASPKCSTSNRQKVCVTTKKNSVVTETWDYRNDNRKNLAKRVKQTKNRTTNKLISQRIREYHNNGKLKYNRLQEVGVSDVKTYFYDNGQRRKLTTIKYNKETKSTDVINTNKAGKFTGGTYVEVKRSNNATVKEVTHYAHENGKVKEIVENRFDGKTKIFNKVQRFNDKGQEIYNVSVSTGESVITDTKSFENGKVVKSSIVEKKNNVVIKESEVLYHSPGGYRKSVEVKEFNNNNLVKHYLETFSNAKGGYKTSLLTFVYSGANISEKNTVYLNASGKTVGVRNIKLNNGVVASDVRNNFMSGSTTKIASTITTTYHSNNNVKEIVTNNFVDNKVLSSRNVESFNENNKRTQNMNYFFNGKEQLVLQKGYTYQSGTYSYIHNELNKGVKVLEDKTTYKDGTIIKTEYVRSFYRNGNLVFSNTYKYENGNIKTIDSNTGAVIGAQTTSTTNKVASLFPITFGTITSPSWFYPSNFGGGWHPAIDVAPFSMKDVGFKQSVRWTFESEGYVLSRHNGCATTNSYGCGPGGFGNHVMLAFEHEGNFYTILFGHMTKLSTTGSSKAENAPAVIFDRIKPGRSIHQDDIIGLVGSSGNSSGYHTHIQIQQHTYATSIEDIKERYIKENKNLLFNVNYNYLSNAKDILTVNPDVIFNLRYAQQWQKK